MYFQNLESLNSNVPTESIQDFIFWLSTLAPLYRNKINPQDYAINKKITTNLALTLFDLAVSEEILKPKILIEDDYGVTYGFFYKNSDIPKTMENHEYNYDFKVKDENKKVYFEMINNPKVCKTGLSQSATSEKNISSVSLSQVKQSSSLAVLDSLGVIF
ncbi:hypothetical protein [Enterococcus italicus]|uniref:hypothetical protein n=1 Tax=Enterococcus italicus TaxID=246144 RepID=UPI0028B1D253|nr:hypothetical protein [Enterococcus italicus]